MRESNTEVLSSLGKTERMEAEWEEMRVGCGASIYVSHVTLKRSRSLLGARIAGLARRS
jgi:hypothetical protein